MLQTKLSHSRSLYVSLQVYRGYMDDPRNTDNAWVEALVYNAHAEKQHGIATFQFVAGIGRSVYWRMLFLFFNAYA